jgi:dipeptidase D
MSKNPTLELEPKPIWKHFEALNSVPRPSKQEERVIAFMRSFGESLKLPTLVDAKGNVVIKKPATSGMESRPTVVLQSHLDMVHQKNADTEFDFNTEGIRSRVEKDWVTAEGTTLGADNGIGVAAIMAVLEADDLKHPPIEALFTIDEETGMTGAKGLDGTLLEGSILLNLDTEDDDEITIGCAGGIDSNTHWEYREEPAPKDSTALKITVRGLRGGHSGMDIHKGRGNANKLMNRLLYKTGNAYGLRLAFIDGGSLRNAIPRESTALVVLPEGKVTAFQEAMAKRRAELQREYAAVEPDLKIEAQPTDLPEKVMALEDQEKALSALYAVPNGVWRMSPELPDLVETSTSLARVILKDGSFVTQSLQRSSLESGKHDVASAVRAALESIGATVQNDGDYPGWAPNADSKIMRLMQSLYRELFGEEPKVSAVHAGLECGIIGQHYPELDMISFGPTIRHAHSPDEKVSIESVQKFWRYLTATLERVA